MSDPRRFGIMRRLKQLETIAYEAQCTIGAQSGYIDLNAAEALKADLQYFVDYYGKELELAKLQDAQNHG